MQLQKRKLRWHTPLLMHIYCSQDESSRFKPNIQHDSILTCCWHVAEFWLIWAHNSLSGQSVAHLCPTTHGINSAVHDADTLDCTSCRLILGDKLHVKAVLGMPNVALHAEATEGYDSAWCSDAAAWPAATPLTGTHSVLDTHMSA